MSRVDDLIKELCPNGVTFVTLEKLFHIKGGYTPPKSNPKNWETSEIPWFRMEDIRENGPVLDAALSGVSPAAVKNGQLFPADSLIVATSATIGEHALIRVPYLCNQRFVSLQVKEEFRNLVDIKFLHYYAYVLDEWCLSNTTQSSFASVQMKGFKKFKFPIPPLEIQQEIARILDKFTQLEAELEAELEARRKQYAYYRDRILSFSQGNIRWEQLSELATIGTGKHDTKDAVVGGEYIFYARGRQPLRLNSFDFDEDAIITAGDGAGVGKVFHFVTGKYALHQRAYRIVPNERIHPRYLYHYLLTDFARYLEKTSVHASVTSLRRAMFLKYPVPVPEISEQYRIVAILDKFDALVNDISTGLPAEIAARRKQYEYYRDKLLSFEPAAAAQQ